MLQAKLEMEPLANGPWPPWGPWGHCMGHGQWAMPISKYDQKAKIFQEGCMCFIFKQK